MIDEIDGPVLLVAHSYGGSVITAAATADNVVGLVYLSGFAPDEGENLTDLQSTSPRRGSSRTSCSTSCLMAATSSRSRLRASTSHSARTYPADDAAFYAITHRPLAGVALTEAARHQQRVPART